MGSFCGGKGDEDSIGLVEVSGHGLLPQLYVKTRGKDTRFSIT